MAILRELAKQFEIAMNEEDAAREEASDAKAKILQIEEKLKGIPPYQVFPQEIRDELDAARSLVTESNQKILDANERRKEAWERLKAAITATTTSRG